MEVNGLHIIEEFSYYSDAANREQGVFGDAASLASFARRGYSAALQSIQTT